MDELIQQYKNSLTDNVFSRKEKQSIIRLIQEKRYDKHQYIQEFKRLWKEMKR